MTELADIIRLKTEALRREADNAAVLLQRGAERIRILEAHARRCAELARQASTGSDLERQMAASLLVEHAKETP